MISIGSLAKDIIIRAIVNCDNAADQKARILIARQEGILSEDDAELMLKIFELEEV